MSERDEIAAMDEVELLGKCLALISERDEARAEVEEKVPKRVYDRVYDEWIGASNARDEAMAEVERLRESVARLISERGEIQRLRRERDEARAEVKQKGQLLVKLLLGRSGAETRDDAEVFLAELELCRKQRDEARRVARLLLEEADVVNRQAMYHAYPWLKGDDDA